MDWNAIQQYLPLYQKAAVLTVRLGVAGIIFAIIIGLACAVIQYDKVPVLRQIVGVYIQLSRNTPLLVQLFFIYYGLPKVGIRTNAEICGIAGLAFLGGSYMAEAFRSGLEAIEPIQTESAYSLGMDRLQTMRYVIQGDQRVQRHQPDGPDVHGQGSHRYVFQDHRMPVPAGGVLPHHPAAGIHRGQPDRKEAALCWIWVLTSCSRAKTWPA